MKTISSLDWRRPSGASLVLRGVRTLDPRAEIDAGHDIVVRDGTIAELRAPGSTSEDHLEQIDAEGMLALPAFFDPHVHLRTPGREDEEDLETGTRAAAAGGYCGIVAMANTEPPVDSVQGIRDLREGAAREAFIPVGFLATVTRGMRGEELTDMVELREAGAAGFSDDGLPIRSARIMRRALQYQRVAGGTIALHEEDPELSGDGVTHEGEVSAATGLGGIPSISESTMIARDAAIAGYEGGRIHVQHLSAAASVQAMQAAKEQGISITAEATPHHLTLTHEAVRSLDARFKMNPPLRAEADRQSLIEGLRSGTIDCIGTDHAPHSIDEKEVPFEQAAMGVTGLETAFAVLYTDLVLPGILELGLLVERMSAGARCLGFEPPSLSVGSEANIVLVDPGAEWEAGAEGWESRSENSCFAGRKLTGRVLMTVAGGSVAYRQRAFAVGVAA